MSFSLQQNQNPYHFTSNSVDFRKENDQTLQDDGIYSRPQAIIQELKMQQNLSYSNVFKNQPKLMPFKSSAQSSMDIYQVDQGKRGFQNSNKKYML